MNFPVKANILSLCNKEKQSGISIIGVPIIPMLVDMFTVIDDYKIGLYNPNDATIMIVFKVGFFPRNGLTFNVHRVDPELLDISYNFESPTHLDWCIQLVDGNTGSVEVNTQIRLPKILSKNIMVAVNRQFKVPTKRVDVENKKLIDNNNPLKTMKLVKLQDCTLV